MQVGDTIERDARKSIYWSLSSEVLYSTQLFPREIGPTVGIITRLGTHDARMKHRRARPPHVSSCFYIQLSPRQSNMLRYFTRTGSASFAFAAA